MAFKASLAMLATASLLTLAHAQSAMPAASFRRSWIRACFRLRVFEARFDWRFLRRWHCDGCLGCFRRDRHSYVAYRHKVLR